VLGYHVGVQADEFRALVKTVVEDRRTLGRAEAREVLSGLLARPDSHSPNSLPDALPDTLPEPLVMPLAGLLSAMAARGETAEELCGFAEAMRAAATPVPLAPEERARLVDTCGTGGDGLDTLNISTAAALVAAGAGAWVAKHGNRAVTSRCGSADVLEALGVPTTLEPEAAAECLRATGFMFLLAPALHPAMRRVGPVRRALPFRTIFNLAGPLTNPAGASAQVVGVYAEERIDVVAEALRLLGVRHAWVVHGRVPGSARGLDELSVTGESVWASVTAAGVRRGVLWPESLGLRLAKLGELRGRATAGENAELLEGILRGREHGARRDIVLLNAGAALVVAGIAPTLGEGVARAEETVDSGAAAEVLGRLRSFQARASVARFRGRHLR
jgi:anthranilate phosphoribosyltransferase